MATFTLNVNKVSEAGDRADVTVTRTEGETVTNIPYTGVLVDTEENRLKFLQTIKNEEIKLQKEEAIKKAKIDAVVAVLDKDVTQALTVVDWAKEVK